MKFLLKDEAKLYLIRSDQPNPTIYFSFLPQFAEELKAKEKSVLFLGSSFAFGILGNPASLNLDALETLCKETSTKETKISKKDEVKFDFKVKGKKPIVTKGIKQVSITGENFNVEKIVELLTTMGVQEL